MPNEVQRIQAGNQQLNTLTVGKANSAWIQPYGTPWSQRPLQPIVNTFVNQPMERDTYANMIEVERGEHDATIRFYRTRNGRSNLLVKEITIPIGLLDWLKEDA